MKEGHTATATAMPKAQPCSPAKVLEPIVPSIAALDSRAVAMRGQRSFSCVETSAAEATVALLGVKVMAADMPQLMQVHAFWCGRRAYDGLDKFSSKQIAHDVKKEFDKVYHVWANMAMHRRYELRILCDALAGLFHLFFHRKDNFNIF